MEDAPQRFGGSGHIGGRQGAFLLLVGAALAMFLFADDVHRLIWMGSVLVADGALNAFVTMYTVRVRVRKKNYLLEGEETEE